MANESLGNPTQIKCFQIWSRKPFTGRTGSHEFPDVAENFAEHLSQFLVISETGQHYRPLCSAGETRAIDCSVSRRGLDGFERGKSHLSVDTNGIFKDIFTAFLIIQINA